MYLSMSVIPKAFADKYNLYEIVSNNYNYIEVRGSIHGQPKAGRLVHD